MARFFKENIALLTGLTLPLLLIVFFTIAGRLSESAIPDPAHDLIFAVDYYPNMDNRAWAIAIESGKIVIRKLKTADDNAYNDKPRLYLFHHADMSVTRLNIDFDKVDRRGVVSSPDLEEINRLSLLPKPTAPDGYSLQYKRNVGTGFLGDIFGMSNRRSYYALVNGPRTIALKGPDAIYNAEPITWIYNAEPIAWIGKDSSP